MARLVSRSFGGYESLQLEIRDVAGAGLQAFDTTEATAAAVAAPVSLAAAVATASTAGVPS